MLNGHNLHIVGFEYQVRSPAWLVRSWPTTSDYDLFPLQGKLSIEFTGPRICTGFRLRGTTTRRHCPHTTTIESGGSQCPSCRKEEGFLNSFFVKAGSFRHDAWQEYAESELFVVYLAAYSSQIIKVGMALRERVQERLREQGAWAGCVLYEGDGYEARNVEKAVAGLGYPEAISAKQRSLSICPIPERQQIFANLLSAFTDVVNRIQTSHRLIESVSIISLFDDYYSEGPLDKAPSYIKIPDTDYLLGTVRFVKGNMVVLERNGELITFDAWRAAGWMLNECPEDHERVRMPQLSLF